MSHKIIRPHENDQISCRLTSDRKKIEFRLGGGGTRRRKVSASYPKRSVGYGG